MLTEALGLLEWTAIGASVASYEFRKSPGASLIGLGHARFFFAGQS